jgi:hypothetical protein
MARIDTNRLDEPQREFIKLIRANSTRHRLHEVFSDFCELAALSLSNAVDRANYEKREARYLAIVGRYERSEVERFPIMLARVVDSLERGFHDCLGQLFMNLELGDHWKGRFFTPYHLASLMAKKNLGDVREVIERQGFFTANEPAAGAGGMVIALAEAVHDAGVNYQQAMHVVAQDIDATAVHMTYIQLTLLHVPAIVIHGNALRSDQSGERWFTPAHVLGGWDRRLRDREDVAETPATIPEIIRAEPAHQVQQEKAAAPPLAAPASTQLALF